MDFAKALAILMEPLMPIKMEAAWKQLGLTGQASEKSFQETLVPMASGQALGKPEILFTRMEESAIKDLDCIFKERIMKAQIEESEKSQETKGEISFEQFGSLDIRIGEIKSAEQIKGSDKLLRLMVDIGKETRQVVAGIAKGYSSEDLVGTQVVVLVNLKPAKLFGIESQAMLLAADEAGKAVLLRPHKAVETGTKVR